MIKAIRMGLAALAASAALTGCVTIGAQEKEGQLAAAGFVRQQADTPQKMTKLQALPQNTIVVAQRKRATSISTPTLRAAAAPSSATTPPISSISKFAPPTTSRKCRRPRRS